jgi:hypothetical protein
MAENKKKESAQDIIEKARKQIAEETNLVTVHTKLLK